MHSSSTERDLNTKVRQIIQGSIWSGTQPNLIRIEASTLSKNDEFLRHVPRGSQEEEIKEKLISSIQGGLTDFYKFNCDPCFNNDWSGFIYQPGRIPAIGKTKDWWDLAARRVGGRLGKTSEYIAFLGILMKKLIEAGWNKDEVWDIVCNDSAKLGNYINSYDFRCFEQTASRERVGFYDLANVYKLTAEDGHEDSETGVLVSGYYLNYSYSYPLASINKQEDSYTNITKAVGWIVFDEKITLADLGGDA